MPSNSRHCQLALALTVAEEPEVADAVEAVRENMDQEPADELVGGQGHRAVVAVLPVVLPAEADLAVVDGDQPAVRDSDAMGVAPDIGEDLVWAGEGPLGIHHPVRP